MKTAAYTQLHLILNCCNKVLRHIVSINSNHTKSVKITTFELKSHTSKWEKVNCPAPTPDPAPGRVISYLLSKTLTMVLKLMFQIYIK